MQLVAMHLLRRKEGSNRLSDVRKSQPLFNRKVLTLTPRRSTTPDSVLLLYLYVIPTSLIARFLAIVSPSLLFPMVLGHRPCRCRPFFVEPPSYFLCSPSCLGTFDISTMTIRCGPFVNPDPTLSRHHDTSLMSVNADLPTFKFIVTCCNIIIPRRPPPCTIASSTFYHPIMMASPSNSSKSFLLPTPSLLSDEWNTYALFFLNLVPTSIALFACCTRFFIGLFFIPPTLPVVFLARLPCQWTFLFRFLDRRLLFIHHTRFFQFFGHF